MSGLPTPRPERRDGVHELKFPVPAPLIEPTLDWMRSELRADPHGGGEAADTYLVQSLYLDTPDFDVFHRRGSYGRAKFRIRRYGEAPFVFLERKLKRAGIVRKRRLAVEPTQLDHLASRANGQVWPGAWFHHRLALRQLAPVVEMNYLRVARLGADASGPFRVTLDRQLRATRATGFSVPHPLPGDDLLAGNALLEVKFDQDLPATARRFIEKTRLAVAGFSKYRTGVRAAGWVPADAPVTEEEDEPEPIAGIARRPLVGA